MGTDIHAHVEVQVAGQWLHFNAPHVERDYALFTKMAGVREATGIEPIARPRGLPEDLSDVTRILWEREKDNAHSTSHLTRAEIEALGDWYLTRSDIRETQGRFNGLEGVFGYVDSNPLASMGGGGRKARELFDDIRIVFWFDC